MPSIAFRKSSTTFASAFCLHVHGRHDHRMMGRQALEIRVVALCTGGHGFHPLCEEIRGHQLDGMIRVPVLGRPQRTAWFSDWASFLLASSLMPAMAFSIVVASSRIPRSAPGSS